MTGLRLIKTCAAVGILGLGVGLTACTQQQPPTVPAVNAIPAPGSAVPPAPPPTIVKGWNETAEWAGVTYRVNAPVATSDAPNHPGMKVLHVTLTVVNHSQNRITGFGFSDGYTNTGMAETGYAVKGHEPPESLLPGEQSTSVEAWEVPPDASDMHLSIAGVGGPLPVASIFFNGPVRTTPPSSSKPSTTTKTTDSSTSTPQTREQQSSGGLSCEPGANAKADDPSDPHKITNKDCPALNEAKRSAQEQYQQQQEQSGRSSGPFSRSDLDKERQKACANGWQTTGC